MTISKVKAILIAALVLLSTVTACNNGKQVNHRKPVNTAIMMDQDIKYPSASLIRIEEQKPLPVDKNKKPYLMLQDQGLQKKSTGKAQPMVEQKPK